MLELFEKASCNLSSYQNNLRPGLICFDNIKTLFRLLKFYSNYRNYKEVMMIPEMTDDFVLTKKILEKHERRKVLEFYFSRSIGEISEDSPDIFQELYSLDLRLIRSFLSNQNPKDEILQRVFNLMD